MIAEVGERKGLTGASACLNNRACRMQLRLRGDEDLSTRVTGKVPRKRILSRSYRPGRTCRDAYHRPDHQSIGSSVMYPAASFRVFGTVSSPSREHGLHIRGYRSAGIVSPRKRKYSSVSRMEEAVAPSGPVRKPPGPGTTWERWFDVPN